MFSHHYGSHYRHRLSFKPTEKINSTSAQALRDSDNNFFSAYSSALSAIVCSPPLVTKTLRRARFTIKKERKKEEKIKKRIPRVEVRREGLRISAFQDLMRNDATLLIRDSCLLDSTSNAVLSFSKKFLCSINSAKRCNEKRLCSSPRVSLKYPSPDSF